MLRAGPLEALLTALLAKNQRTGLPPRSGSGCAGWSRWPMPPPSELPQARTWRCHPTLTYPVTFFSPTARHDAGGAHGDGREEPLEAPASDPATAPTVEPSTGTAAAQPRTGPVLPPAPPVRRPIRGWTAGVLALLVIGGLLLAWHPVPCGRTRWARTRRHRRRPAPAPGWSPTRTERPRPGTPRWRHRDDPVGPVHQQRARHHPAGPVNSQGPCHPSGHTLHEGRIPRRAAGRVAGLHQPGRQQPRRRPARV